MDFLVVIVCLIGWAVAFFVMLGLLSWMKIKNGTVLGVVSFVVACIVFGLIAKWIG